MRLKTYYNMVEDEGEEKQLKTIYLLKSVTVKDDYDERHMKEGLAERLGTFSDNIEFEYLNK